MVEFEKLITELENACFQSGQIEEKLKQSALLVTNIDGVLDKKDQPDDVLDEYRVQRLKLTDSRQDLRNGFKTLTEKRVALKLNIDDIVAGGVNE